MKTKYFILFIIIVIIAGVLIELNNTPKNVITLANGNEKLVINEMNCWNSFYGEALMRQVVFEDDEKKKDKLYEKRFKEDEKACLFGQKALLNDTVFIYCIRDDSIYKEYLKKRKTLTDSLRKYRKCIPIFTDIMDKTINSITEYKYYSGYNLGLFEPSFQNDGGLFSLNNNKYYNDINELFKEAYIQDSTNTTTERDLKSISNLLNKIEKIDRHIWCIPYFQESSKKIADETIESKTQQEKSARFDSITE